MYPQPCYKEYYRECIRYDNLECFRLLEKFSDIPSDCLIFAVTYNQEEILKYLFTYDICYISRCHAFYHTITSNKLNLLQILCPDDSQELHTGLQIASSEGIDYSIFLYLCQRYHGSHYAFFMKACEHGRLDIIQYIFYNGKSDDLSLDLGMTYAARSGYFEIVKFLRLRGCDLCFEAFSAAISSNYPEIVEYFLINGYRTDLEQCFVNACSQSKIKISSLLIPYLKDTYVSFLKRYGSEESLSRFNVNK